MNKIIARAVEDAKSRWRSHKGQRAQTLDRLEKTIADNVDPSQARPIFLSVKRELEAIK